MKTAIIEILVFLTIFQTGAMSMPQRGSRADIIDETNLTDAVYVIQSLLDNRFIGAFIQGDGNIETWMGPVTVADQDPEQPIQRELLWHTWKDDVPYEDAIYLGRQLITVGPNGYNDFSFDLPAGNGSFPVTRFWRLRNWEDGVIAINRIQFFDFGIDDDHCAQNNGLNEKISYELCDQNDARQQWNFVPADNFSSST